MLELKAKQHVDKKKTMQTQKDAPQLILKRSSFSGCQCGHVFDTKERRCAQRKATS
jgi:hypothetical protein